MSKHTGALIFKFSTPCNIQTATVQKTSVHIEDGFGAVCPPTGQHSVSADGKVLSALVFYNDFPRATPRFESH